MIRKSKLVVLTAVACVMALGAVAQAQGPLGPPTGMIYANDDTYKTIGTPAVLPNQGEFNDIYVLGDPLANVADAAPGDMNWRGGRWAVRPITWLTIPPTQFTNADQIHAAAQAGQISIGEVVFRFECPLIPEH